MRLIIFAMFYTFLCDCCVLAQTTLYKRIGGSSNAFSTAFSQNKALCYSEELNTIGMVFRKESNWTIPTNNNSGAIVYAWSSNNGVSWDSSIIATNSTILNRYPTGAIFNPSSNTTISNAFAISTGPFFNIVWRGNYFATKQLNSTPSNQINVDNGNLTVTPAFKWQEWANTDIQTTTNNIFVLGTLNRELGTNAAQVYPWQGVRINKGVYNGTGFDWYNDSLMPIFKMNQSGDRLFEYTYNQAWSEDGQIGYVVFFGVDSNNTQGSSVNTFHPLIYKTINGGTTWSYLQQQFFCNIADAVYSYLKPTRDNPLLRKPYFTGIEGSSATIDASGELHLFCSMRSASSDHPDSLRETYPINYLDSWNYLVDYQTDSLYGLNISVIDSLNTSGPSSAESNWYSSTGNLAYNARLQLSKTKDGNFLFYSWVDSDTVLTGNHINTLPNIKMVGCDLQNKKMTLKKDMSSGKLNVEYNSFWFYTSRIVKRPNSTSFQIPTSITTADDTINADLPVSHYYIDDNQFNLSEFNITISNIFSLCNPALVKEYGISNINYLKFYPNPVNTSGVLEFSSELTGNGKIVIINAIGQIVFSQKTIIDNGLNRVQINLKDFSKGLYIIELTPEKSKPITSRFVIDN